jgi:hypothetical protein
MPTVGMPLIALDAAALAIVAPAARLGVAFAWDGFAGL